MGGYTVNDTGCFAESPVNIVKYTGGTVYLPKGVWGVIYHIMSPGGRQKDTHETGGKIIFTFFNPCPRIPAFVHPIQGRRTKQFEGVGGLRRFPFTIAFLNKKCVPLISYFTHPA
jgi:hypothetical protein